METINKATGETPENFQQSVLKETYPHSHEPVDAFTDLARGMLTALETYSNVHRGSGHNSMVSTHLFEQAREIILEYLGLNKAKYVVIFCSPRRATALQSLLDPKSYRNVSSRDIGLSLGVRALAVKRNALPKGVPFQTGGGTTKLISKDWVIWADAPDKFEAGTPAIINIIAFTIALRMIGKSKKDIFMAQKNEKLSAAEILYHDELMEYSGRELLDKFRESLIGKGISVPTTEGSKPFINLDNSASTPTFTPIWNTFRRTWRQPVQVQQEIVNEVRKICAGMLGAPLNAYEVIFTSNTTESINLAAESLSLKSEPGIEPVILNTILEHSSNDLPWRMVPGYTLVRLSVDIDGFVDLNELEKLLGEYNQKSMFGKKRIRLVALSGASNVLGVCNNITEISRIVHRHGAHLLVDAAQLVAHRTIGMESFGIDYLAFSAHKVYAPFGCGVLVVKKDLLNFSSVELQLIQSSGEENAGGIAALGKAFVILRRIGMALIQEEEQAMTGRMLNGITQIPGIRIYGIKNIKSQGFAQKLGVVVFGLKGTTPNRIARELALKGGIGVRYGCHCAHIIVKHLLHVSPFLEKFQRLIQTMFPKLRLPGLVRLSLGIQNSAEDVDKLIEVLGEIAGKLPAIANRHTASPPSKTSVLKKADVQKQMNEFVIASAMKVYSQMS